jgi:hypothetical protein
MLETVPKSIETTLCPFPSFTFSWNKLIEGGDKCTTELALAVKTVLLKLQTQHSKHFILHTMKKLLIELIQDGEMTV